MDPTHRESLYRAEVHGDGGFELRNLPPGEYIAIVTTLRGEVVTDRAPALRAAIEGLAQGTSIALVDPTAPRKHTGAGGAGSGGTP